MTVLEVLLILALLILVPAVVWLAVDTWALHKRLDDHGDILDDLDGVDTIAAEHDRRLAAHHFRLLALEDARNTTDDLDVPDPDTPTTPVYRPVPEHFNEWR